MGVHLLLSPSSGPDSPGPVQPVRQCIDSPFERSAHRWKAALRDAQSRRRAPRREYDDFVAEQYDCLHISYRSVQSPSLMRIIRICIDVFRHDGRGRPCRDDASDSRYFRCLSPCPSRSRRGLVPSCPHSPAPCS
ncbi:hypothetical protein MYA_4603 [Burkholderia sp. KJ006]|nr:hypothetical protein MYA_4603 [Burkholderia sp. KJ006]